MVHVGEMVEFSFVLVDPLSGRLKDPSSLADYCAATIGNERVEAEPDVDGRFRFSFAFAGLFPGDGIKMNAAAYRQRGSRDFMKVRDRWLESDSPYDRPDKKVAADSITFSVYQAVVDFAMEGPPENLDPDTGVLRFRRGDGSISSVYVDRPNRPGFELTGPQPDGRYQVFYRPTGEDLNHTQTTDVDFTIYDRSGQPHNVSLTLETP